MLAVLYLIFNEGYAATEGPLVRFSHDGAEQEGAVGPAQQEAQRPGNSFLAIARAQKGDARRDHPHREVDESGRQETESEDGASHAPMIPCGAPSRGLSWARLARPCEGQKGIPR